MWVTQTLWAVTASGSLAHGWGLGLRLSPTVDVMAAMLKPGLPLLGRLRQVAVLGHVMATVALPGARSWGPGVSTSKSVEAHQLGIVHCLYSSGIKYIFLNFFLLRKLSKYIEFCQYSIFHLPENCHDKYTYERCPLKCNVLVQYTTCVTAHGLELTSWAQIKSTGRPS